MADLGVPQKHRIPLALAIYKCLPLEPRAAKPQMDRHSISLIASLYRDDAHLLDTDFFHKPIFLKELEIAVINSPEDPIDLSLDKNFNTKTQALVASHAAIIHNLLPVDQASWASHYDENRKLYNMGHLPKSNGGGEIQKRLQAIAELFTENNDS